MSFVAEVPQLKALPLTLPLALLSQHWAEPVKPALSAGTASVIEATIIGKAAMSRR